MKEVKPVIKDGARVYAGEHVCALEGCTNPATHVMRFAQGMPGMVSVIVVCKMHAGLGDPEELAEKPR